MLGDAGGGATSGVAFPMRDGPMVPSPRTGRGFRRPSAAAESNPMPLCFWLPRFRRPLCAASALVASFAAPAGLQASDLAPVALRCEYRSDPLGIDETQPLLSWRVESGLRAEKQTAFQILVASSPELLAQEKGDLWDTGRIAGDETTGTPYAGAPLVSRE